MKPDGTGVAEGGPRSVALVLPYGVLGAAEDYMLLLADGMAERGWQVSVAHPSSTAIGDRHSIHRWRWMRVPDGAMLRPWTLKQHLQAVQPDIIHINQVALSCMAAGALIRSAILVVTAHNPALPHHYGLKGRTLARIVRSRPDAWIVLSERNRALLAREGAHRRSIHIVPPGLPPVRFDTPLPRDAARKVLNLRSESFIVGTVGRLSHPKRHDVLIRALSTLTAAIPELNLVILGDGELKEQTKRLATELMPGRVTFAGHRPDVPTLLEAFDVFAMSSDFEGLPFALLEAMAASRAIVTTDVQGAGEAVRHGSEALVVPRRDPKALASAIATLARNKGLARRLGQAARERFVAEFTADLMVDRTEALYAELLATRNPSA